MNGYQKQLMRELRQAGASDIELVELVPIANRLGALKTARPEPTARGQRRNRLIRVLKPTALLLSGAALGMAIILFSQSVLPGSWLYPVQRLSDNVAVAIHPDYRATIMMRRAQQVNQLVANHAKPSVVLATLADYSSEAATYKSTAHTSYAAFEYCKTNLQQAAAIAPANVHRAILDSLDSLETV